MPAPPLGSEPAMVRATGGTGLRIATEPIAGLPPRRVQSPRRMPSQNAARVSTPSLPDRFAMERSEGTQPGVRDSVDSGRFDSNGRGLIGKVGRCGRFVRYHGVPYAEIGKQRVCRAAVQCSIVKGIRQTYLLLPRAASPAA
jgi:hypothetical protein